MLEPLSGYLELAAALAREPENAALASAFNFGPGPGEDRSVKEVVGEILKHWPGKSCDTSELNAPHEAGKLNLAIGKAERLLGWRPAWSFKETIAHTVDWYRRHAEGASAVELCREQIAHYVANLRR